MKRLFFSLAFLLLLGTCVRAQRNVVQDGFPVRVNVAQGELEGIYSTATGVQRFLGVPFAAPPVGDRRWRAPQPAVRWTGVREAKTFGPRAIQKFLFDDMRFRSKMSEDCLYLNVWTPAKTTDEPLSILLYFHGGGNVAGSGDELRYDGEKLAQEGIIVVTANYRLGVFGFLAHPELSAESGHGSGNYGLMDQVAALDWVRANAAAFGGDPERITIGGESAGSIDCSILMASPLSRDKIAGVVGQSGAAMLGGMTPRTLLEGEESGRKLVAHMGKKNLADLRRAPTREIYERVNDFGGGRAFGIVLDGHLLREKPITTYTNGQQARVPLMVGWTSAETAWVSEPASAEAYRADVLKQYGKEKGEQVLKQYPASDYVASNLALSSDKWIVLGTWKWADLHTKTGNAPVFRYQFDRIRPALTGQTRAQEPPGAGHATDIEYFFNTLNLSDAYAWGEADEKTARTMSRYLANFVRTGNPQGEDLTDWPAAKAGTEHPVMHLNETSGVKVAEKDDRYRLLEQF